MDLLLLDVDDGEANRLPQHTTTATLDAAARLPTMFAAHALVELAVSKATETVQASCHDAPTVFIPSSLR